MNDRIEKIREYNAPMARSIEALRQRYAKLYQLPATKFDAIFQMEAKMGVVRGDFRSRKELLEKMKRR